MELQGKLLGRLADQKGWDCRGWVTFGPEMAIVTIGDTACMVEHQKASLNQLIAAMTESVGG
jgi:roadblock/LC7 domain-containing protein